MHFLVHFEGTCPGVGLLLPYCQLQPKEVALVPEGNVLSFAGVFGLPDLPMADLGGAVKIAVEGGRPPGTHSVPNRVKSQVPRLQTNPRSIAR